MLKVDWESHVEQRRQLLNITHPERRHPESPLAHKFLDGLTGIEIGAAAYAPFGVNAKNVGLTKEMDPEDYELYKNHQIEVVGKLCIIIY